jgi:hypothetical protein
MGGLPVRLLILIVATLAVTSCVSLQKKHNLNHSFDYELTNKLLNMPGKNVIKGSALMRQKGGGTVTCAGGKVTLLPATSYSRERVGAIYGTTAGGYNNQVPVVFSPPTPAAYTEAVRTTLCDAQGFFTFEDVGDGDWYLQTYIVWGTNAYMKEGGSLAKEVTVKGNKTVNVVLAP